MAYILFFLKGHSAVSKRHCVSNGSHKNSKSQAKSLIFKETSRTKSKYSSSFITIYDLSYRLREQKQKIYKPVSDLKIHLLENSGEKLKEEEDLQKISNKIDSCEINKEKSDGSHLEEINSDLNANSNKILYKDIISRVLKSNIPFQSNLN